MAPHAQLKRHALGTTIWSMQVTSSDSIAGLLFNNNSISLRRPDAKDTVIADLLRFFSLRSVATPACLDSIHLSEHGRKHNGISVVNEEWLKLSVAPPSTKRCRSGRVVDGLWRHRWDSRCCSTLGAFRWHNSMHLAAQCLALRPESGILSTPGETKGCHNATVPVTRSVLVLAAQFNHLFHWILNVNAKEQNWNRYDGVTQSNL